MQPNSSVPICKPIAIKPLAFETLAIEIVDMGKRYGSTSVLEHFSLSIAKGELLVVLGESGSGKSTLLRLIAGLETPQNGTIQIAGADQSRVLPHKRDVAVVFQDGNGYEHLTVRQNLELAAQKGSGSCQISDWVDLLKLGGTLNQKLAELSGGQSQRVAIARAMLSGKSIVLLDEPLAHLNQSLREEIRELIRVVHRETNRTFVYVTHDSDEAFYLADRIAVLESGKIQQVGDSRMVYCSPQSKEVAHLLGQPAVDFLTLPRMWLEPDHQFDASVLECGVRSHNWKIRRIEIDLPGQLTSRQPGLSMTNDGLVVRGTIANCRWMGSRWWLEIECTYPEGTNGIDQLIKIRITCEAKLQDSREPNTIGSKLLEAEKLSQAGHESQLLGYVEAIIPRDSILRFCNGSLARTTSS